LTKATAQQASVTSAYKSYNHGTGEVIYEVAAFSVSARPEEESRYFGNLADVKRLTGRNTDQSGNLIAAYASAFMNPHKVVAALSQLQATAGR